MIKDVKLLANAVSLINRPFRIVGIIEFSRIATEHFRHGKIRFPVAVITGRIKDDWRTILQKPRVTGPEIAVEQGWGWIIIHEKGWQVFHQCIRLPEG